MTDLKLAWKQFNKENLSIAGNDSLGINSSVLLVDGL